MKLAIALSQRAELQTRIRQLESRLHNNALVQEGERPALPSRAYPAAEEESRGAPSEVVAVRRGPPVA